MTVQRPPLGIMRRETFAFPHLAVTLTPRVAAFDTLPETVRRSPYHFALPSLSPAAFLLFFFGQGVRILTPWSARLPF